VIEKSAKIVNEDNSQGAPSDDIVLLRCPIRGDLTTPALAKDGLTATEEARRIDFIEYLLDRGYPADYIAVETVVLKGLGESGRNSLRADVIVYDLPRDETASLETDARLERAVLVGEIKRDSAKKPRGITCQLEPAMRQLPGMRVLGAYWDDMTIPFAQVPVSRE
jgi:type I restriction enzyme M protein